MTVVSKLTRVMRLREGRDCVRKPCGVNGCGQHPKSSHGVRCDEWIYTVHDEQLALTLVVFSGDFPATVPAADRRIFTYPKPGHMVLCEQVDEKEEFLWQECLYLGKCQMLSDWSLYARTVWEACQGGASYVQEDAFWHAFEQEFLDHRNGRLASGGVHVNCRVNTEGASS